jgi:SSS family solute:Na+ symporter
MSIAAANLFTRNIYKEYMHKTASPAEEARVSRLMSLLVKAGAVVVILVLDPQFSIDLQLIGGVIIVQTLPSIVIGLYSRVLHAWGLLAGWAVGMAAGLYMLYDTPNPNTGKEHFGGAQYALSKLGIDTDVTVYTGLLALALNLIVAFAVTAIVRATRAGRDAPLVFDSQKGMNGPPQGTVLPGESITFPVAVSIGKDVADLQVDVTPGFVGDPAIFSGQV